MPTLSGQSLWVSIRSLIACGGLVLCCLALALQVAAPSRSNAMTMIEICGEGGIQIIAVPSDNTPESECPKSGDCSLCMSFGAPDPVQPAPGHAECVPHGASLSIHTAVPLGPKRYQTPVSRGPPGGNSSKPRLACPTKIERGA